MTCAGRRPPRTTHSGTQKLIAIIEACGAEWVMLPPMVVFKGTARYKGWYTAVTEEEHAYFAYSPNGYTTVRGQPNSRVKEGVVVDKSSVLAFV